MLLDKIRPGNYRAPMEKVIYKGESKNPVPKTRPGRESGSGDEWQPL
jgi:hypothetical protein